MELLSAKRVQSFRSTREDEVSNLVKARPKLEKLHQESDQILGNIIHEHKKRTKTTKTGLGEAQEDLVDVFLRLQQDGDHGFSLTDSNIKAVIWASMLITCIN
ncbi:hypothetical protein ACOSP7_030213 [Xanthoceras sorbifolium]